MTIKAVFFDLDNTLIDFIKMKKKASDAAISAMIKSGLKVDKKVAWEILNKLFKEYGMEDQKILDKFLKIVNGKVDIRILASGVVAYRNIKENFLEPYPNVIPTLTKLKKKGYTLGIITDAPKFQAWTRLYGMKLERFFDFVITPEDAGDTKLSGLPFRLILKKLKLKPEEIIMVGDSIEKDIIPAKKLEIKTILAKYGQTKKGKVKPNFEIKDISEILRIVS